MTAIDYVTIEGKTPATYLVRLLRINFLFPVVLGHFILLFCSGVASPNLMPGKDWAAPNMKVQLYKF